MGTITDPEIAAFVAQRRAARGRRLVLGLGVALALTVLGGGAYLALRPTPCEKVVDRICPTGPECVSFRKAVTTKVPVARCLQALESLDAVDQLPGVTLRTAGMTQVVRELVGVAPEVQKRIDDAASDIAGPMDELDRTGVLTPQARQVILRAPPEACLLIVGKMGNGQPFTQQPLHEMLVAMNGGKDLGTDPDGWTQWCQRRSGLLAP